MDLFSHDLNLAICILLSLFYKVTTSELLQFGQVALLDIEYDLAVTALRHRHN
jgi:hypothetical protein